VDAQFDDWARERTPSLLRAAYVLTGQQQAAEDLVQSALEKVAVSWRRIRENPDAYARQVLYRMQIRRWRRKDFREHLTHQPPERDGRDETGDIELRLVVESALQRLTWSQRCVLVLRFYEDLSETDAAAVLSCSVGTIKSQTHKALRALRQNAPELAELVGRKLPTDV
jgi:RNA polymerase sigma-70 factor (sigma-E family)